MNIIKYIFIAIVVSTIFSCEKSGSDSSSALSSSVGKAGSLAKFAISGNYLYGVSMHYLYAVNISDPSHPVKASQSQLSFDMETIYPYKNYLFIGSKTGLYIYSLDDPAHPAKIGEAKHGRSCDPVVANDSASYSTLKGSTNCGPATSGLYVYDVKNLNSPVLKTTIPINEPRGLGIADTALYVCAAGEGMKVYSIKNGYDPVVIKTITGADFTDLIPYDNLLICWTGGGIRLYDISNRLQPVFIKQIDN